MQPPLLCNTNAAFEESQETKQEGFKFSNLFSSNFDSSRQARLADFGRLPFSATSALLAGPPKSGKTTLLFQYAHNHLLQNLQDVALVIAKRQRLEGAPPLLPQGVTKTSPPYERVHLRYLDSDRELRKYFACIHLLETLPSLIVVDDFADFFSERQPGGHGPPPRTREQAFVKTLALLHEAGCFIGQTKKRPCIILVSDTNVGDMPRNLYLYQRWIPLLVKIRARNDCTFTASATDPGSGVDVHASYSLTSASLIFEHIDGKQAVERETDDHALLVDPGSSLRLR